MPRSRLSKASAATPEADGLTGKRLLVGIAELKTAGDGESLASLGLGSCVAVAIYDKKNHLGALAHVMLPCKDFGKRREGENMLKYADVAVPEALRLLEKMGSNRIFLEAKIAGGACMFDLFKESQSDVGSRNVTAVRKILEELKIPVVGADTGGSKGRSVELRTGSGEFYVRTVRGKEKLV